MLRVMIGVIGSGGEATGRLPRPEMSIVKMSPTANGASRRALSAAAAQVRATSPCSPLRVSAAQPGAGPTPLCGLPVRDALRRSGHGRGQPGGGHE